MRIIMDSPMDFLFVFKALSDETRLRLVNLLVQVGRPLCVCEMVGALDLPQYQVSRHLALLRHLGLVQSWRQGARVYYEVNDKQSACLQDLFALIRRHFRDRYVEDVRRVQGHDVSREGPCPARQ